MVTLSVREALRDAMAEEMRRDDSVFHHRRRGREYEGAYKVTQGLLQEFGARRVVDTADHRAWLCRARYRRGLRRPPPDRRIHGLSTSRCRRWTRSSIPPPRRAICPAARWTVRSCFAAPMARPRGVAAQHSQDYAAWYSHIPGLKVVMPYTASDAKGLLKSAIRDPNPVIFLRTKSFMGTIRSARARRFSHSDRQGSDRPRRQGPDRRFIRNRHGPCLAGGGGIGARRHRRRGPSIFARSARWTAQRSSNRSRKTGRCVTVEEGWPQSGVGAEIIAKIMEGAFDYLDAPVVRICGKDVPMPYAANLEKLALPNAGETCRRGESGALPLSPI